MKSSAVLLLAVLGASCMLVAANEAGLARGVCDHCGWDRNLVCGTNGHTYLNKCWAECAKTEVKHEGSCRKEHDASNEDKYCEAMCPVFYQPECGVMPDGTHRTYMNPCFSRCDFAYIIHDGVCKSDGLEGVAGGVCDHCGWDRDLVCGTNGHTYLNKCWAECAKTEVKHEGSCRKGNNAVNEDKHCEATCPVYYKPECGVMPDGTHRTYMNPCFSSCDSAHIIHDGVCKSDGLEGLTSSECQKECPKILKPVCGMNNKSYANACRMECDGVELKHEGRCAIQVQ